MQKYTLFLQNFGLEIRAEQREGFSIWSPSSSCRRLGYNKHSLFAAPKSTIRKKVASLILILPFLRGRFFMHYDHR